MGKNDEENNIKYYKDIPTYQDFLKNHLLLNKPVVFGPALTETWKARQEWVTNNDDIIEYNNNVNNVNNVNDEQQQQQQQERPKMKPRLDYLKDQFGTAIVGVADCIERDFTDQKRSEMTFEEFVNVWPNGRYYLKDWHFVRAFPEYHAYDVPKVFEDDWMNEYWLQENKDDYRFVYMGGDGTFTPLHADVYRSYSWSSNICGIKRWTLFPPGEEKYLKDRLGNLVYDLRSIDHVQFPNTEQAKRIIYYQRDGETIFVPSGWYHQVENIGLTISINHNWSNACNLGMTFRSLVSDLDDVEKSIDDLRECMAPIEFGQTCHQLLFAHSGWDCCIFTKMLYCISRRLHDYSEEKEKEQPKVKWQAQQILTILEEWKKRKEIKVLDDYLEQQGLSNLINDIKSLLLPLL